MRTIVTLLFISLVSINLYGQQKTNKTLVLASELNWSPLNPARGDNSPKAANLWGDRTEEGATGFLVQFKKGFSSPPHVHNVTYRGIVLDGKVHNDDPKAGALWMPAGSYWTQPAGEVHITSATGDFNLAYIEIQEGPYLVKPTEEAFDNGERPINVEQSNMAWVSGDEITWIKEKEVAVARLWNDPTHKLSTSLIKLPAGFDGTIKTKGSDLRVVTIKGSLTYENKILEPGSYFGSNGKASHLLSTKDESIIYVRSAGSYWIK